MPVNTVQDRTLLAGLVRGKQSKIQWLNATVPLGDAGQFTEINLDGTGFTTSIDGNRLTITFSGGSGFQTGIQWQDEGVNLGTSGTVNTVNFVGSAVAATRVGNVVTVTVTSSGGTVTSVALSMPAVLFSVTGSPITNSGTFNVALATQSANRVFAGPTSGGAATPTFRALVAADLPANSIKRGPGCIFTNGGLTLTGTLTSEIEVPYAFTGTGWTIVGDATGSASIVVSHSTFSSYDTMSTLFTATCSSAKKAQSTSTSFSLAAGDILRFSGSGFSGFTRCSIQLDGTPS